MAMAGFRSFVTVASALALAWTVPGGASAQAAKSKPVLKPATASAASTSWTCVSRASVEIAPVSFDTAGEPAAFVVVHRMDGEVIAAERVSPVEVQKLRRLPCGTPDSDLGGVAAVG
jgi:hypothetical protein